MTSYYAIVGGDYIQKDLRNEQLEIYETKVDALRQCPKGCSVVEVDVVRMSTSISRREATKDIYDALVMLAAQCKCECRHPSCNRCADYKIATAAPQPAETEEKTSEKH